MNIIKEITTALKTVNTFDELIIALREKDILAFFSENNETDANTISFNITTGENNFTMYVNKDKDIQVLRKRITDFLSVDLASTIMDAPVTKKKTTAAKKTKAVPTTKEETVEKPKTTKKSTKIVEDAVESAPTSEDIDRAVDKAVMDLQQGEDYQTIVNELDTLESVTRIESNVVHTADDFSEVVKGKSDAQLDDMIRTLKLDASSVGVDFSQPAFNDIREIDPNTFTNTLQKAEYTIALHKAIETAKSTASVTPAYAGVVQNPTPTQIVQPVTQVAPQTTPITSDEIRMPAWNAPTPSIDVTQEPAPDVKPVQMSLNELI